jgi:hypothetical protein
VTLQQNLLLIISARGFPQNLEGIAVEHEFVKSRARKLKMEQVYLEGECQFKGWKVLVGPPKPCAGIINRPELLPSTKMRAPVEVL